MRNVDEPVLPMENDGPGDEALDHEDIAGKIRGLLMQQQFAVLCTQGGGQAYGSVVAYAVNDELDAAVFCTGRATRKYSLLTESDRIALVVDNRSSYPDELMQVEAITATGRARELSHDERVRWAQMLIDRHPQLRAFVTSPSTAVFRIDIVRYLYVTRFQEVHQWVPGTG
jgi:nitroimidazol reductase NimA-like FMN-containing flavoprotein (pyridoxamine 5'-phosphate oxidase superfamily)